MRFENPRRKTVPDDDMLPEYDFSDAVRGKYFERYCEGTNVVLLDPDVARVFPDSAAVNRALRELVTLADASVRQRRRGSTNARSKKALPSRRRDTRRKASKSSRSTRG
ncbi:MAG: hypothetical protein GEU99_02675 [Luteitalea sp.]|nr:hypothetical protein [Luteitalea sp.]